MANGPDTTGEEMLDAVEPSGTWLATLPRSVVHAEGHWHQVFHCLVVRSGVPARVLLQRRKATARAFPDLFDISVAGHLGAGESPLDGVREIREELGLPIDPSRLVPLGRRLFADDTGEGRNREIAHVYLAVDDTPLADLALDPAEVGGFAEIDVADLERLLADPEVSVTVTVVDTEHELSERSIRSADLVPALDAYWTLLAIMARRLVEGSGPLGI